MSDFSSAFRRILVSTGSGGGRTLPPEWHEVEFSGVSKLSRCSGREKSVHGTLNQESGSRNLGTSNRMLRQETKQESTWGDEGEMGSDRSCLSGLVSYSNIHSNVLSFCGKMPSSCCCSIWILQKNLLICTSTEAINRGLILHSLTNIDYNVF